MDELKLSLNTKFMKGIVSKLIAKAVRKKLGCDIDILVNQVNVTAIDGKIRIHADVDAETTNEEVVKLIKSIGLE